MGRTNKERVLEAIWAASPAGMTNGEIQRATGIASQQAIYLLTRELVQSGWIEGEQQGREWVFWANESAWGQLASPGRTGPQEPYHGMDDTAAFTRRARGAMRALLGVSLVPGTVEGVPREFELVSPDRQMVGSVVYCAPVQGQWLPPAKFSLIGERVWLLDKTGAEVVFLVFGYDRDVPWLWLSRYGHLAPRVQFYYLSVEGALDRLDAGREAEA